MTVKELLKTVTCDLYITMGDDPNFVDPDIILSDSLDEPEDVLGETILNHEINLITVRDNAVYVSLNIYNR